LCPGGALSADAGFFDDAEDASVFGASPGSLPFYGATVEVNDFFSFFACQLDDSPLATFTQPLARSEAEACQAHLRVSCGQPVP